MLEGVKWGEFRVGDLFEVSGTKSLDRNAIEFTEKGINFVGRTFENNGVQGKIEKRDFEPNEPFTITATVIGNYKYVKLQKDYYYCSQNINKLIPKTIIKKWNEKIAYYLISNLQKFVSLYDGQQGGYKLTDIKSHIIKLPIFEDGTINFAFIEKFMLELEATYISDLEALHISELDAYLRSTGLKDYELTIEEIQVLEDFKNKEWLNPKIEDLFEVNSYKKRFNANEVTILDEGRYPYIVRTAFNNGVRGYLKEDVKYLNDENTISFGQDTATMFYQKLPYFTGDKIKILKYKEENFNENKALFLITSMRKSFASFTWGINSYSEKVIKNKKIKVPVINEETDSNFMEVFISAIKKLVIKDVVEFSKTKILAAKEIVGQ